LTLLLTKRRTITRYRITEAIYRTKLTPALRQVIVRSDTLVWVPLKQLDRHTLSGPHRRWIRELRVKFGI
jgi:A/G-specific adenine glycosylase